MGLYDRDYTREGFSSQFHYAPQMRMAWPKPSTMVARLLIINVAVFVIQLIAFPKTVKEGMLHITLLDKWLAVYPYSFGSVCQVWRLVTYQFLHGNFWHVLFNMYGLYILGPRLEQLWGGKRFLLFYLGCGIAGAIFYTFLVAVGFLPALPMIGASGAVLGLLAACAILFPTFVVFIFPIPIPITIRLAAIIFTGIYIFTVVTRGANAGGDAAHLAGMAAGALFVFSQNWQSRFTARLRTAHQQRKFTRQQSLQADVDRILEKVHAHGIASLTYREKNTLKKATKSEQQRAKP
jgi:membrane associated rhomboid family serine protease